MTAAISATSVAASGYGHACALRKGGKYPERRKDRDRSRKR
ncbi:MAG: hypothetical protein SPG69_05100 [Bacteroides pyogenes]|nr:hypothetical protein [Bacteroides pyogenes]MDY5353393.1 hypothetical protein [Bacteroides pyogenes]